MTGEGKVTKKEGGGGLPLKPAQTEIIMSGEARVREDNKKEYRVFCPINEALD